MASATPRRACTSAPSPSAPSCSASSGTSSWAAGGGAPPSGAGRSAMTAGAVLLISSPERLRHRPRDLRHGPLRRPGARHLPGAALRQARGVQRRRRYRVERHGERVRDRRPRSSSARPPPLASAGGRRWSCPWRPSSCSPPRFFSQAPRPSARTRRTDDARPVARPCPRATGRSGRSWRWALPRSGASATGGRISWPTERASPARPRPPP